MRNCKIAVSEAAFSVFFLFLLFQDPIETYAPSGIATFVGYIDELVAVVCLVYLLINLLYTKIKKTSVLWLSLPWIGVILLGIVVGIINNYQTIITILFDAFLCLKFIIVLSAYDLYANKKVKSDVLRHRYVIKLIRISVWILMLLFVHDLFFTPFFPKNEFRYFMRSMKLMFSEPTALVATCVTMMALFAYDLENNKSNYLYMIFVSILIAGTLKAKGLAVVVMCWILVFSDVIMRSKNKNVIVFFALIVVFFVGYGQFEFYFIEGINSTSRGILLRDAIRLANQNLFGTGLASFGSYMAQANYSPLYEELGYGAIWGMSRSYSAFLCDNFLALILGQFGWPGMIAIFLFFVNLYKKIRENVDNKYQRIALLILWGYLGITALGETSIFNSYAVLIAIAMGVMHMQSKNISKM